MFNKNKGFTLIELLVVIAIIGILAAIALTSLGSARNKAKDSSAISSISSARAAAEIFADSNGNAYTGVCADTEVARLTTAAQNQTGNAPVCNASASAYAISVQLLDTTATSDYFCVDSTGKAQKQADGLGSGVTACS